MSPQLGPYVVIFAMLALVLFWNHGSKLRFGYRCIQCGTQKQDEHSEDCSWNNKGEA